MSWNSAARRVRRKSKSPEQPAVDVLDDGDRVAEHVLVAVDRVVLEAQRRQLGQEVLGEAGVDEEPQPGRRAVDDDQLVELVADPLGRHDRQPVAPLDDGGDELGHRLQAEAGDEAGRPQHPQRVVVEADLRRRAACAASPSPGRRRRRSGSTSVASAPSPTSSRAIALTVKSRRARSASMSSANVTCGLRESSA